MDIQEAMKRILSDEITRENDEKGSGGFYDLSLNIVETYAAQHIPEPFSADYFNMTEAIYNALWGVLEEVGAAKSEGKRLSLVEIEAIGVLLFWHRGATYLSGMLARLTEAMRKARPDYLKLDYDKERAALLQAEKGGE